MVALYQTLYKKMENVHVFVLYQVDVETAQIYFIQILNACLEMHHKGVFHRDIKLENVTIKNDAIKVIDFGFSKYVSP
jgi:serine/threonine protein kinase